MIDSLEKLKEVKERKKDLQPSWEDTKTHKSAKTWSQMAKFPGMQSFFSQ